MKNHPSEEQHKYCELLADSVSQIVPADQEWTLVAWPRGKSKISRKDVYVVSESDTTRAAIVLARVAQAMYSVIQDPESDEGQFNEI